MNEVKKLVEFHKEQPYGRCDYQIPYERLRNQYASLPNEALYIVDCKATQLEPLTKNFAKITGTDDNHKNELTPLFDHVNVGHIQLYFNYSQSVIGTGFYHHHDIILEEEGDWASCIYKTEKGKLILKSSTILKKDSKGLMRYSVGKLTDITGLVKSEEFSFRIDGPNSDLFFAVVNEMEEMKTVLGRREMEILALIGKGMTSWQIADRLYISKHTVDTHRRNIIEKLETNGTIQAYNKARDMGLI